MGKRRRSHSVSSKRPAKRPKQKTVYADIDEILYHVNSEAIGQPIYLIKWPSSWEPAKNVADCNLALARFEAGNNLGSHHNTTPYKSKDPTEAKYEVYKILQKREKHIGHVEYLVEWKLSWELEEDIEPKIIQNYLQNRKSDIPERNVTINDKRFKTTAFGADEDEESNEDEVNAVGVQNKAGAVGFGDNENVVENEAAAIGFDDNENDDDNNENGVFVNEVRSNVSSGYCSDQHSDQENIESNNGTDMSLAGDFESDNSNDEDDVVEKVIAINGDKSNYGFVVMLANGEYGFIERDVAVEEFPQKVIEFYQSRINFLVPDIPVNNNENGLFFSTFFKNTFKK